MPKKLLLINPWIYDFAAYDLWSKPLGLLYLASYLRACGYDIQYIDCLQQDSRKNVEQKFGRGPFRRQVIEKPAILKHIPRNYARYGILEQEFIDRLKQVSNVDAVLVTSIMTYWYPGVQRVVQLVRQLLPGVPVILGGIYASLMPGHAKRHIAPDYLVTGPGEEKTLELLQQIFSEPALNEPPKSLDDFPYPAFDLLHNPSYLVVMTERGCPYNCSFCAQKLISRPYTRRSVDSVLDEFELQYKKYKKRDFSFYDDALFISRENHIMPILEGLIRKKLPLRLHAPNGLFARYVDAPLAELMYKAGFKTVRLSFETSNEDRRADMGSKVSNQDMLEAVEYLQHAGFKPGSLQAYVLMGLPDQSVDEVLDSILFIHGLGLQSSLASFSPIPGTVEFEKAVSGGLIPRDIDPLLLNNSIFPLHREEGEYQLYRKIRVLAQTLNEAAQRGVSFFTDTHLGPALKRSLARLT